MSLREWHFVLKHIYGSEVDTDTTSNHHDNSHLFQDSEHVGSI